MVVKDDTTKS